MSATMYDTVAPGQPFSLAAYPGAQPIIAAAATGTQTNKAVRQHLEHLRKWRKYTNIHNALKKQLTEAIEPVYLRSQRDQHVGLQTKASKSYSPTYSKPTASSLHRHLSTT
jgi:hypothetical protein